MDVIKVSGNSRTSAVAGAIAGVFRDFGVAEIQAIGAGAVNQSIKAMVLAKGYLLEDGYDIVFTPEFSEVDIDGKVRTAIKIVVEERNPKMNEIYLAKFGERLAE
jgi:stage V sporulation protein S